MAYQVLARKWRPRFFSEMVGQEHVLQALSNALDSNRLHHAYLFSGTRGVGKTTIARLLSKCLNCEVGVQSTPCGECSSCKEVSEGRFIDLIEVDAASKTKIDDTRDLLDRVQYAPSRGRFKIYLIDEVHQLSGHSFNALLKTLEEPPSHVKFLLATTEPKKLPVTVLSRCLQFNLNNLSPERIANHLKYILDEESIPFDEPALWSLARAADGSMRDALSLTEQAIGHGNGKIIADQVNTMLGTIGSRHVIDLCSALSAGDGETLLRQIEKMAEQAPDYERALGDILSFWHKVAIYQSLPDAIDETVVDFEEIVRLADQVSHEDVQLFYQICLLGRKDLKIAPNTREGFEMVMLRAIAFRPDSVKPASSNKNSMPGMPDKETGTSSPPMPADDLPKAEALESVANHEIPKAEQEGQKLLVESTCARDARPSSPDGSEKIFWNDFSSGNWVDVYRQLDLKASLKEIASHCSLVENTGSELGFVLEEDNASLYNESHQQSLAEVLSRYFVRPITVRINIGASSEESPKTIILREQNRLSKEALDSLNADPSVAEFKRVFDGRVDIPSVFPRE